MFCAKEGKMLKNCFFVSVLTSVLIGLLVGKIESFPGCENSYFAGRNIALRQRAEQSGTYKTFVARKAVDGNTDTAFKSGSCAHTAKTMTSAWWRVYFDKPYTISGVIIYPRDDSRNARRLKDFEVTGYELSHNAYILYNDSTLQQYKKGVIKIKNDRYIRTKFNSLKISVPPRWHQTFDDGTSVLHLCEVQVYTYSSCQHVETFNGVYVLIGSTTSKNDGYEVDDVIKLKCDNGFVPNLPNIRRTCLTNGSWSGEDMYCMKNGAATEEVSDSNKSTVSIPLVGIMSGIGGAFIATIIFLAIWLVKYRRTLEESSYTDLHNVNRNAPSYDQITPGTNRHTDVQCGVYEIVV